ncbi:mannosyl-oligosaccharide 1,2-alpha-mannosidase IB-like [Augochlora pura]
MRLMQRLAVSGLLSVILIVLLTGTFVTRRSLVNMVDRGVAPEERSEPVNPTWVLHNTVPGPGSDELKNEDKDRRPEPANRQSEPSAVGPPPIPVPAPYAIRPPNPPLDDVTNQRREKIKEMMKHGWDNYVRYAWGKNELKPISKKGHSASIFGAANMGATIVDGLDTLYIMGLHDEFKQGRDWIAENLDFDINSEISLFETNIRFMGSLLACYALTGDVMFRDKAAQLGERMLPAFQTETGIPHSLINLHTGASKNYGWASSGCSILSEIGTMHLEFNYLSDITGNPVYKSKVENVRKVLKNLEKPKGLYPNYIHPRTGKWGQRKLFLINFNVIAFLSITLCFSIINLLVKRET